MTQRIFLLALPLLLGSCAALPALAPLMPSGSFNAETHTGTTVKLEQANFVTLKTNVVGMDKGFALLGIITIVPARFSLALDKLYAKAEMQPGRPQDPGQAGRGTLQHLPDPLLDPARGHPGGRGGFPARATAIQPASTTLATPGR